MLILLLLLFVAPDYVSAIVYPCDASAPCGCSSAPAVTSRIYGGEQAANSSWGWTVYVSLNNSQVCSGTLISSSWVLAAAACFNGLRAYEVYIAAAIKVGTGWEQRRTGIALFRHPDYNLATLMNNFILLQLSSSLNMTDPGIARICLPAETTTNYPPMNASVGDRLCLSPLTHVYLHCLGGGGWLGCDSSRERGIAATTTSHFKPRSEQCLPLQSIKL